MGMNRFLPMVVVSIFISGFCHAQTSAGQSALASPAPSQPAISIIDDTEATRSANSEGVVDPASLLPDLPPLPHDKATLIGGTIERLDRVRDELTIRVFGGDRMKVDFDPRTDIYQNGEPATVADLRQGDRVYVDTVLNGNTVFARSIRLRTASSATGESEGRVLAYRPDKGELTLRDALSPRSIKVRLDSSTEVTRNGKRVAANLVPGTLVSVRFGAEAKGRDLAREISILAVPGESFTFSGTVTSLDLRTGLLVITSRERRQYEIFLDPQAINVDSDLRPGAQVTALTRFDGSRYVARQVTLNAAANPPQQP
jgi:Domain of unknown function (DUF5666)